MHDEFRFHLTLTGGLPSEMLANVEKRLAELYKETVTEGPVAIDSLMLFRQDHSAARFRIIARAKLT